MPPEIHERIENEEKKEDKENIENEGKEEGEVNNFQQELNELENTITEQESNKETTQEIVSKYQNLIETQKGPIRRWNPDNPKISLTFDDGYWLWNIEQILDKLENTWITATFFILGECIQKTPDVRKKAIEKWHQICCHTYSHAYLDEKDTTKLFVGHWIPAKNTPLLIQNRTKNVKAILWEEYYQDINKKSWDSFPYEIPSDLLLETEILMWENQIKTTLWNEYFNKMKQNYPFFRFPGWCWASREKNITILKKHGYLSIGWSDDFYRKWGHASIEEMKNTNIKNWDIPLFHFKEPDLKYIDAYLESLKNSWKTSTVISETITP